MWDEVADLGRAGRPNTARDRLRRDLADSLEIVARLRSLAAGNQDDQRLLAVVTAAPTSELFLPYTIPLLLRQADAAGLGVDLILGLNNGYGCPEVVDGFASLRDVSIAHLVTGPKKSRHHPAAVVEPGASEPHVIGAPPARHRIFVVHQCAGPWSAGKDLMLLDLISGFVVPNLARGWRAPAATLVFDAEAVFTEHEPDPLLPRALDEARRRLAEHGGNPIAAGRAMIAARDAEPASDAPYDLGSPGLRRLIAEWRDEPLDILGPATKFCAFGTTRTFRGVPVLMPTPSDPISAMHLVYNHGCGLLAGCSCMSGAATLARTEVLAGLLTIVLGRYPDVYAEDALVTVLAEQAGLRLRLTRRVQFTNRCAGRDERAGGQGRPAWMTQFAKWYRAFDQVERLYGSTPCASVLGPTAEEFLAGGLAVAARGFADPVRASAFLHEVAQAGLAFAEIRGMVAAAGDPR